MPDISSPDYLELGAGGRLAYRRTQGMAPGMAPGVTFLCGHGSDMEGTKALEVEAWARQRGHACLRFDYRGHGLSSGDFLDGNISSWTDDCLAALDELTAGPQLLVGSSLGGWLMLNVALARPDRVAGLIGIAAAPDFTEDLLWAEFDDDQRRRIEADGVIALPNPYSDEPVQYPWHLITDGRDNLRLRGDLDITAPAHLLHGMQDEEVPWQTATNIAAAMNSPDVEVTLVKAAGHRFSEPDQLALLRDALDRMADRLFAA
ncbi:MAG: alpha/beta hydrolase [Rhodobiaceae bacterium]|jgi:pimeloyl-ACP methyl ester carboxylesterase